MIMFDKVEIIQGKSYLSNPIVVNTEVIKRNKLTILNHICSPKKDSVKTLPKKEYSIFI